MQVHMQVTLKLLHVIQIYYFQSAEFLKFPLITLTFILKMMFAQ